MFDRSEVIGGRRNRVHGLATIGGKIAMAYQGETPWHALGTELKAADRVTVAAVLAAANLANWQLRLEQIQRTRQDGSTEIITDRQHVVRGLDDTYVATVGPGYTLLGNEDAFAPLDDAMQKFGVEIETAGAIDAGKRVWVLARMKEQIEPVPGDTIQGYLLMMLGHDGLMSYFGKLTPERAVCRNTIALALAGETSTLFTMRHTKSITDRTKQAEALITTMVEGLNRTNETFTQLAKRRMTAEQVKDYIASVMPAPAAGQPSDKLLERLDTIKTLAYEGKGAREFAGSDGESTTAWGAYNAVLEYLDHVRPAEAKKATARTSANFSTLFGANEKIKLAALRAARQMVAA